MLRTALSIRVFAGLTVAAALGVSGLAYASAGDADPLLSTGITAYRSGAPLRALQSFAEAVAKAPNDALPALWAGVAAAAVGRWQDARAYLHEALRRPHTRGACWCSPMTGDGTRRAASTSSGVCSTGTRCSGSTRLGRAVRASTGPRCSPRLRSTISGRELIH